jgi:riboflavin kinase/FMN adenylyltransferase
MQRVLTTGNFDGCHLGHALLFDEVKKQSIIQNLEPLVISFEPHTQIVLKPDQFSGCLTLNYEKERILTEEFGLNLTLLPFTSGFRKLTAVEYVRDILIGDLKMKSWVVGYDHRFGKAGSATESQLTQLLQRNNINLIRIPAYQIDDSVVSSGLVRKSLMASDISSVNRFCNRKYSFEGRVIPGDGIGRQIGFPTANLKIDSLKMLPPPGVYGGTTQIGSKNSKCVLNIGMRPTFSGNDLRIEVHLLDFNEDIYGQKLLVKLDLAVRKEKKFSGVEELKHQILQDIKKVRGILEEEE